MSLLSKIIAFGVLLVSISFGYYFAIALPSIEREKLAFDKLKYENSIKEKKIKEELVLAAMAEKEKNLITCQDNVANERNKYLEMNGTPIKGKPGTFNISQNTVKELARIEKDGNDNCVNLYGK
jgi:hypothetical protein